MNYYIQGSRERAEEIEKAFKRLGYDTTKYFFNAAVNLYFTFEGGIRSTADELFKTFIKSRSDYQELKLPIQFKFNVSDWIVRNDGSSYAPIQVYDLKKDRYLTTNMLGSKSEVMLTCQDKWRLWTIIKDAKDGDVLVSGPGNPFIYNGNIEFSSAGAYVGVSQDGKIRLDMFPSKGWTSIKNVKPATKEQCDLLFAKIKEVGYQWDAEKKELHKITDPKFNVGDWVYHNRIGVLPVRIKNYSELQGYEMEVKEKTYYLEQSVVENQYHLWTIQDAKEGDVLIDGTTDTIGIFKEINKTHWYSKIYCGNANWGAVFRNGGLHKIEATKPATKEQCDLLFAKIREAGYEWNAENKELRKIKPHYDVSNFYAGMPVLVRDKDNRKWCYLLYSHYDNTYDDGLCFNAGSVDWRQCIPFEGNEHLLGTTDMPSEEYINW